MMFRLIALSLTVSSCYASASGLRELQQPSAKFTAFSSDEYVVAQDCLNTDVTDSIWGDSLSGLCTGPEGDTNMDLLQSMNLGLLKVPNGKEVLIGLSAQVGIFTLNTATSKKGPSKEEFYGNVGATSAMAGVDVRVELDAGNGRTLCAPGDITLQSRQVELVNRIGGNATYVDCYNEDSTGDGIPDSLKCVEKIAELELESSIGLAMQTVSANSFQFVCPDLPTGVYSIIATFSLSADVDDLCEVTGANDCTLITDPAASRVVLGPRIVTAQTVRAVKGALEF